MGHKITTTVDRHNISILSPTTRYIEPVLRTVTLKWCTSTTSALRTLQGAFILGFKAFTGGDPPPYPPICGWGSGANMSLLTRWSKRKRFSWILYLLCQDSLGFLIKCLIYFYTVMAFGRLIAEVNFGY